MEKYAIFIDIDGTLAYFDNFPNGGTASKENIAAIEEVRSHGHYVFLNTGRAYAWINNALLKSVPADGVISGIGTQVLFHGETIFEKNIDRSVLSHILNELLPIDSFLLLGGTDGIFTMNTDNYPILNPQTPISGIEDFDARFPDAKIQKIEIFASTDKIRTVLDSNLCTFHHEGYSEAFPNGVSKSNAMLITLEKLGIPLKNCIAMGDSINDIDMLKTAGISVAMGDAAEDIKALCDFVSLPCREHGVAYALKKLVLKK